MQVRIFEKPGSNICAAFLTNNHSRVAQTLTFRGQEYFLPPHSISVLPDCKTVVYNTQTVITHFLYSRKNFIYFHQWELANILCILWGTICWASFGFYIQIVSQHNSRNFVTSTNDLKWKMSAEPIPTVQQSQINNKIPNELYFMLKDTTDYGWYSTRWDEFLHWKKFGNFTMNQFWTLNISPS